MKTFTTILTISAIALMTMTLDASADDALAQLSKHDQLKARVQGICPVSGKPLGSMGTPLKTRIGEEELFLCCKGCTQGQVSREHWGTIHANFAKAQGRCPVMKKPLPANAKWTVVDGQIFYVCCPPCVDKIKADPKAYLMKLDALYEANTAASSDIDAVKASVQKICPVSGKPLGSMGGPIKTKIGQEELYLCCEACAKGQVSREHWTTIHANFATAQKICPIMEKPLPANPKWTVVNGHIVYVCCPPCTKKIEADPNKYTAELARLYQASPDLERR